MYVVSCVGTFVVSQVSAIIVSRVGTCVVSCQNLVPLDALLNLVRPDARLAVGDGADSLGDGLLVPWHGVVAVGLHVIGHLVKDLLVVDTVGLLGLHVVAKPSEVLFLVATGLPEALNDSVPHLHGVLCLAVNLLLHLKVVGGHGVVGTCDSRVRSAQFRAGVER